MTAEKKFASLWLHGRNFIHFELPFLSCMGIYTRAVDVEDFPYKILNEGAISVDFMKKL